MNGREWGREVIEREIESKNKELCWWFSCENSFPNFKEKILCVLGDLEKLYWRIDNLEHKPERCDKRPRLGWMATSKVQFGKREKPYNHPTRGNQRLNKFFG